MNQLKAKIVLLEKADWIEELEKGRQGSENTGCSLHRRKRVASKKDC